MKLASVIIATSLVIACSDQATEPPSAESSGSGGTSTGGAPPGPAKVDIVRDALGVAHLYGESAEAAFYGLGWASAQDRLYQMDFSRRYMRGRLSETFAKGAQDPQGLLEHDVHMRTLGFAGHAEKVLAHPDFPAETRALIDAYVQGVNDYVASGDFKLPSAFAVAGIASFEPWTAVDTLLAWGRIRERFTGLDMQQEIDLLNDCRTGGCPTKPCTPPIDEDAAVVPETSPWPPQKMACNEVARPFEQPIKFKASHAWAVHGSRTTTGKPVLAMDPKLGLTAPSMWYAYSIAWPDHEARGIGVAGAPGYLVFWNRHVAQSLTAVGASDISDLFRLETSGEGYTVDGQLQSFDSHTETIAVEGAASVDITVRETVFGPVVTPLLKNVAAGEEFALRHSELVFESSDSIVGAIDMISADGLDSYRTALGKIATPFANAIFATDDGDAGHIGYSVMGAIGKRVPNVVDSVDWGGRYPYQGNTLANDWQGTLSMNERPHVTDPTDGYVFSANHLPVGSWFDDYTYTGLIGAGDTLRSLRLRYMFKELLPTADAKLSPADVHAMHFDAQQDAVRIYHDMLKKLQELGTIPAPSQTMPQTTPEKAAKVLEALDLWLQNGGELRAKNPQTPVAELVTSLPGKMRDFYYPALVCKYNASEGGYSFLVKTFDADPAGTIADPDVVSFVVNEAAAIWDQLEHKGPNIAAWQPEPPVNFTVLYQANQYCPSIAGGNCSLDPTHDFDVALDGGFGQTILSSLGSSGTGTIDFADIDASTHLVPMGVSEDPASPFFQSGLAEWKKADAGDPSSTPTAPLNRELVKASSTITLEYQAP